jgi:Mor family transcriptional regulator
MTEQQMNEYSSVIETITRDDMPNETIRQLWDDFGKEVVVKMIIAYGGSIIFPPKRGLLKYYNRMIMNEFKQSTISESNMVYCLSKKYGVSITHIYNIIRNI